MGLGIHKKHMQGLADLKLEVTAWEDKTGGEQALMDKMRWNFKVGWGAGFMPSLNFRRANGC